MGPRTFIALVRMTLIDTGAAAQTSPTTAFTFTTAITMPLRQGVRAIAFAVAMSALFASRAAALEVLCDTAFENCRTQLLTLIDNEQVGIDVGFWVMEDPRYVSHIINRKNAGVPVRVIM